MKIHYHESHRLSADWEEEAIFHDDPYDLLKVSAFLFLNAPETKHTHHFLGARAIAYLPHGAIVVNAARGGIVLDEDMIAALRGGQVAAVGICSIPYPIGINTGALIKEFRARENSPAADWVALRKDCHDSSDVDAPWKCFWLAMIFRRRWQNVAAISTERCVRTS